MYRYMETLFLGFNIDFIHLRGGLARTPWEKKKFRAFKTKFLNSMFQIFLNYYNYERLHLGFDMLTPKEKMDTMANVLRD